jgi:hypothetical protein
MKNNAPDDGDPTGLIEDNKLLGIRLNLARGFVAMLTKAYNALLYHRVNYRELKAYKDSTLLDAAAKVDATKGQVLVMDYLSRVENDISAAVARKGFKEVK